MHPSNPSPFHEPVPNFLVLSHLTHLHFASTSMYFHYGSDVKNLPAVQETQGWSLGGEVSLKGGHGNPVQYSCLENPREQRSLVSYSPGGLKESDMTDFLPKHLMELLSLRSSGISFVKFKSCLTQFHLVIGAFMKKIIYQYIKNSYKSSPALTWKTIK